MFLAAFTSALQAKPQATHRNAAWLSRDSLAVCPVTERITRRWPSLKRIRRPRTRRGWLIAIAASGAILALKLTLGLGVLALVVHLLAH